MGYDTIEINLYKPSFLKIVPVQGQKLATIPPEPFGQL